MVENVMKKELVGHFLDLMKYADEENANLESVGVSIQAFQRLENKLWESIKFVVGMPAIEEMGIFISDYSFNFAVSYLNGKIAKEEAIESIMDWKNDF